MGIRNVHKSYGALLILHGVSIDIADAEFVIVAGPSEALEEIVVQVQQVDGNVSAIVEASK